MLVAVFTVRRCSECRAEMAIGIKCSEYAVPGGEAALLEALIAHFTGPLEAVVLTDAVGEELSALRAQYFDSLAHATV